ESEGPGRLPLLARDGLDAASPDLTKECARVEREGECGGRPGVAGEAQEAGAEVDEIELHQQWRALHHLDEDGGQRSKTGDARDRDDEAAGGAAHESDGGERHGPARGQHEKPELVERELADHHPPLHRANSDRWMAAKAAWKARHIAR